MSKKLKEFKDVQKYLSPTTFRQNNLGADPELFVKKRGRVVGSETVIKETDLIVEDGVQVELHPIPNQCRESFGTRMIHCLMQLRDMLDGKEYTKVSSDVTVDVSKRHYDSLSEKNKQFGCGRSYNAHNSAVELLDLDPSQYLKRSAGGHFHFGTLGASNREKEIINNPQKYVPILDILVGNTAVLLDRDEGNVERRKYYGRAGEYRTPSHGLEYRTLSNFWLKGEPIMSLLQGLSRHAMSICAYDYDKYLLEIVDMEDIINAINNNDYELALKNWNRYKDFIVATATSSDSKFPIRNHTDVLKFEHVVEKGLDNWFTDDIFENWLGEDTSVKGGWGMFTSRIPDSAISAKLSSKKAGAKKD